MDDNTFVGTDALWKTSTFTGDKNLNISAWAAHSAGDLPAGNANGYGAGIEYPNDLWYSTPNSANTATRWTRPWDSCRAPAPAYYTELNYQPRPPADSWFNWVHRFWFYGHYSEYDGLSAQDGGKQSSEWWFAPEMLTQAGWYWELDFYRDYDAPTQDFDLSECDSSRRPVHLEPHALGHQLTDITTLLVGGYRLHRHLLCRNRAPSACAFNWNTPSGRLVLSLQQEWLFYYSPQGDGTTRLSTLIGTYSFSPTLYLTTQMQYQNGIPGVSYNTRLRWIVGGASNIYLVWNHGVVSETNGLGQPVIEQGNEVIFKVQWDFRG